MSTEIGVVSGVIELTDNFTSKLGLAEAALNNFTKENQESLLAVAGAVGMVTAAFGLAAAAVYNLGQRGADVADVQATLEHFSGSAAAAAVNLEALRKGTLGTVDDFDLMKEASHLLSAGVKLNADDFGTLSSAAFVLQNRGLGGTKEMLGLVSDAMVTGRTRALAMALGVVDAGDAEQKLADRLGVTKDQLSDSGKVEAKRIAIMEMLRGAVKDAGAQERDFGEQIEFAKAKMSNYIDEVGKAIATSPAMKAGMDAVMTAIGDAFGGENQSAIQTTMELIKSGAIIATDLGLAMVETARVVHAAWSGLQVIILGVETVISGVAEAVAGAIAVVTSAAASLPGASQGLKDVAASAKDTADYMHAMTNSLAEQAAEAAKGVTGNSDFDRTLDALGGTIFRVRDAIASANAMQEKSNESTDIAANNAKKLAAVQKELDKSTNDYRIDQEKLWQVQKKSLEETSHLWDEYFQIVKEGTGTTVDAQRQAVQTWFDDQVSKLDATDRSFKEHYDAIAAVAREKMKAIGSDWSNVRDKSLESLEQQRDAALDTYDKMVNGSLHFSRDVLDEQKKKVDELTEAARGMGKSFVEAQQAAAAEAEKHKKKLEEVEAAARKAIEESRKLGGSFDVTSQNFEKALKDKITSGGWNPSGMGSNVDMKEAYDLAHKGYSFQEIIDIFNRRQAGSTGPVPPPQGPRIPGFAEGGTVMVGENGPEVVRLPFGSEVYKNGTGPGGDMYTINVSVSGGADRDVARRVANEIMRKLKSQRQFGAA